MYVVGPMTNVNTIQNRTANVRRLPPVRHRTAANSMSRISMMRMNATTKPGRERPANQYGIDRNQTTGVGYSTSVLDSGAPLHMRWMRCQ